MPVRNSNSGAACRTISRADQTRAATAHAEQLAEMFARFSDPGAAPVKISRFPRSLARQLGRHFRIISAGRGLHCGHVDPGRPAPFMGAAWWPGRVACLPCVAAGMLAAPPGETHRCDACRHVHREGLATATVTVGPMIWQFGLCAGCGARAVTR